MNGSFEGEQEFKAREQDALDKLRTETDRHLRKYSRRIKVDGVRQVKAAFTLNPAADPEEVANDAFLIATHGQFLPGPGRGVELNVAPVTADK